MYPFFFFFFSGGWGDNRDVRFCNLGPNWDQNARFSLLSKRYRKICSFSLPPHGKIPSFVESPTKFLSPSTKYQIPCFYLFSCSHCCYNIFLFSILTLYSSLYTQAMLILILINVHWLQKVVSSFEKGSNSQNHSSSDSHNPIKNFSYRKIG